VDSAESFVVSYTVSDDAEAVDGFELYPQTGDEPDSVGFGATSERAAGEAGLQSGRVCGSCGLRRTAMSLIERGVSEGFPLKSFTGSRIVLQFLLQKLQHNVPAELEVFGLVDQTHAAATELL
jgi:hypothetical protein